MNKELSNRALLGVCQTPDYVYEGKAFNMKVRFFNYTSRDLAVAQGAKALAFGMRCEVFEVVLTDPEETQWVLKICHPSYK